MTKDEIIKALRDMAKYPTVTLPRDCEALRMAADLLAQPEQDWIERERAVGYREGHRAALAQRTWVGLTDEEVESLQRLAIDPVDANGWGFLNRERYANLIEAKLKEKNT